MNEHQLKALILLTNTYKAFPIFKQRLVVQRANLLYLLDIHGQAERLGLAYLKQNPRINSGEYKLIEELICN